LSRLVASFILRNSGRVKCRTLMPRLRR
jgi:hypothetical protein